VRGLDRPERLRLAGFAASALLAAGAYGAGALASRDPGAGLRGPGAPGTTFWLGFAACVAGLGLLSLAWWRLGRVGATPRWLLVTGGLWAVPLLAAPPLASQDVYAYACQGWTWVHGNDPYTTGAAPGGCPWVDAVPEIWQHTGAPYGPLAIALSGGAAAPGHLLVAVGLLRLVALAGGLLIAVYGGRLATAIGADPAMARWLGVLSPLVAVHLVSGAHNDALMAGLTVAALAVAVTKKPAVAGLLLGLAIAVKATALIALPFAILLVAPPGKRLRTAVVTTAATALTFAALTLATGLDLGWIGALDSSDDLVQWTSLPTGLGMAVGYLLRVVGVPEAYEEAVLVARLLGLAAFAVIGVATLRHAHRAVHKREIVLACGTALAAFAVLSPVFYPWYALLPLAVLSIAVTDPRTRTALAATAVVLAFLVLPNGLGLAVLTKLPGALLDVALVAAAAVVIRRRRAASAARPGGPATPTTTA
jgi:alpha-1,6-mannosyltransferase